MSGFLSPRILELLDQTDDRSYTLWIFIHDEQEQWPTSKYISLLLATRVNYQILRLHHEMPITIDLERGKLRMRTRCQTESDMDQSIAPVCTEPK